MMKKLQFTSLQTMAAFLLVAFMGLFGSSTANAEDITLGETITISSKENFNIYTFNCTETGTLYVETNSWTQGLGNDILFSELPVVAEENNNVPMTATGAVMGPGGYIYSYNVKAGETYYLSMLNITIFVTDTYKFTLTMELGVQAPRVQFVYPDCDPENPTVYNFALAPELQLMFNPLSTTFDKAMLYYTDNSDNEKSIQLDATQIDFDKSWRLHFTSILPQIADEIKSGCEIKFVLEGVNNDGVAPTGNYVVDGNVVFPYIYIPMTQAVDSSWPAEFLSYWEPGDKAGIAWVKFSGPLKPLDQQKSMEYGLFAGNDVEAEDGMIPQVLDKSKVTYDEETYTLYIDFTGVMRETTKDVMTFIMDHVEDAHNNPFFYAGQNMIRVEMKYMKLDKIEPSYEYTPASGDISNVQNIELWVEKEINQHFNIEGFVFDCGDSSETVSWESCDITTDPTDANFWLVNIPVPAIAKTAENVTLKAIINSFDGYDYSNYFEAYYTGDGSGSGVAMIDAANGQVVIYNMQGMKVNGELRDMPKGIYIVNGKKVIK